jgi:hypothetical protein
MGLFIDEACPRAIGQQSPCFLLLRNPERGSGSAVARAWVQEHGQIRAIPEAISTECA